jgi:hypothetical protein
MSSSNSIDSTDSPKSISKVVSNHADRVMDELFADIEGLLGGDSSEGKAALPASRSTGQNHPPQSVKTQSPNSPVANPTFPQLPPDMRVPGDVLTPPTAVTPPIAPRKNTWRTVIVGLSLVAIATGGGIWWLVRQGKLDLAKVQLPSVNSTANGDVQFSDYLRRALGKIDSKAAPSNPVSIPNPPTQSPNQSSAALPSPIPSGAIGTVSLARLIPGNPPTAEFSINGIFQQIRSGDKIGSTGWTLATVVSADNEVIIKRDNGETRSLKLGQSF